MITKRLFFIYSLLSPLGVFGQFADDFSDSDFTSNPVWSGDVAKFTIIGGKLNSQNSGGLTYYLSTPSTLAIEAEWEFFINLKFGTSGANFVDIYLMSDQADLNTTANGYFVRIGNVDDEISLYKVVLGIETMIIDGLDKRVSSSSSNPYDIRVSRDDMDLWTLEVDGVATVGYVIEGTIADNSVNTSTHFGIKIKQSSAASPINNHFFDNFSVNAIIPDIQTPIISAVTVISSTEVDLKFNEIVEQAISETITNYTVNNGIGQPVSAIRDGINNSLVHLTFTNLLSNGNYQITVQNIEDLNGNAIITEIENFDVLISELAAVGDIVINEIMADPTPGVGLPAAEYIELYNRSDKYIDLANYTLSDKVITTGTEIIAPDQYIILCELDNVTLLQSFGTVIGLSSWNTLTNGGENVTLNDVDNALIIDELTYDLGWYQDVDKEEGGWSLELINPDHQCSNENNWSSSLDVLGGTPGVQNSVFDNTPDLAGPILLSAISLSTDSLKMTFDERLDTINFASAIFTFDPAVPVDTIYVEANLKTTIVVFSELLQTSINYTVSITGLSDCSGNDIGNDQSASFLLTSAAVSNDIIINEILADPTPEVGLPAAEYIELYNRSDKYIDLANYTIDGEVIVSDSKIFDPGDYFILCDNGNEVLFETYGEVIGVISWSSLTNTGKTISLGSSDGRLIDEVNYKDTWYSSIDKSDGGWSIELIDPENLCGEENNWSASINDNGGTPGSINSVNGNKPDLAGPSLLSVIAITSDSLILKFDERLDTTSFSSIMYSFVPNLTIDHAVLGSNFREITVVFSDPMPPSIVHQITLDQLRDCNGNLIGKNNIEIFALSEVAEQGDLLINELLYNPITSGSDFIEVYNNSTKYINLKAWMIANGNDETPENAKIISDDHLLISPQQYLVFSQDPLVVASDYPRGIVENFVEVQSLPSFPNDGQGVLILNPNAIVFDYFPYDDNMQHSLLDDDKGVSLERISFESLTSDPNNWHSAAKAEGFSTPGYVNSQVIDGVKSTFDDIVISPQIFLPNQSGKNDFTTINYSFNQSGFVATVSILDITGRVVSKIAQNELLATAGFFQWDGTMDNGRKARSGAYIVLFEIFDTSGNKKKYKERVVIAPEL